MERLLFIDDDKELMVSTKKYFQQQGYDVVTAYTPQDALHSVAKIHPDCILLDIMLPQMSGYELYKEISTYTDTPVIFISGRADEDSKIKGLLLGGSDYVVKPYSLKELSARIQVQLRAQGLTEKSPLKDYSPLTLDIVAHKAFFRQQEILLSNTEYSLLYLLASHWGETVSMKEIGEALWDKYVEGDNKTIMVTVSRLRKKLEQYTGLRYMIETVWTKGYRYIGERRG